MSNIHKIKVFPGVYTNKWRLTEWPTLEITTTIPEKGCVVDCIFCPQRTLEKVYKGERILSLDGFKQIIDKIPKQIRITFAGFVEPWMNKHCTDMVLYAAEQGHPVGVFTTAIGMKIEDVERIKDIKFCPSFPNGGFVLHLPDQGRLAKHPITKNFIKTMEYIHSIYHQIENFSVMSMGPPHESIKHLFPNPSIGEMYSRAGNLLGEAILKPSLINLKDSFGAVYHGEKPMTCNCPENIYHNVLLPNGDVSLCCQDYSLEHILGNLYTQSYDEILPNPGACFDLCRYCENGISPESLTKKQEQSFIG